MTTRTKIAIAAVVAGLLVVLLIVSRIASRPPPVSPTESVPTTWQEARTSPMHQAHVGRGKVACTACHAAGFTEKPKESACTTCHAAAVKNAHHGNDASPTACTTCHVFGAGKEATACITCHANGAPSKSPTAARTAHGLARHASKEVLCGACHSMHGDASTKARVILADCTQCHRTVDIAHGRVAIHAPHDEDGGDALAALARFAARAGGDAGPSPNASACATCHAPHTEGSAAKSACAGCHVSRGEAHEATHAASGAAALSRDRAAQIEPRGAHVAGHASCVTCHAPHRVTKSDARRCEECHADHGAATASASHATCTTCHTPHAPGEAKSSCGNAGCHEKKQGVPALHAQAHADCASCHDPHNPTASPALACARCHSTLQPKHPQFAAKGATGSASACIGCHAPHAPTKGPTACSSCHFKKGGDRSLHAGGVACVACHQPHDFASNLLRGNDGARAHGIAAPSAKAESAALCARCHATKSAAIRARPGHAECGACHGAAHSPTKTPTCAACHAEETKTAPRGHSACTQCHDAHSGSLGSHASCTSCHANKAKAMHGALAGGCASCHTPHGPKGVASPPSCTSCHAPATLGGLHSVGAHVANCASCHTSHGPPRSERAICTGSCHVDRRGHQPAAPVCKGCHMFRK